MDIVQWRPSYPCKGRVFAAVFPHSDDFILNACGLIAMLLREGYTGYFIRVTDDCMDSYDLPYGETSARIERETRDVADLLGIRKVYSLNYNNHYLEPGLLTELRHRLILLFRFLNVDTVITFDPYGLYEENPDHDLTGKAVEHAAWMAGRPGDLPETRDMGLMPCFIRERFYVARGPQEANCVVDAAPFLHLRAAAVRLHKTPMDCMWKGYREKREAISYEDFLSRYFLETRQAPFMGLSHYEKYRRVESKGF